MRIHAVSNISIGENIKWISQPLVSYHWRGLLMRSSTGYNNHTPTQILQIHCTSVSSWLRRAKSCLFSSLSRALIWDTVEVRSLLYLTLTSSSERKIIYVYITEVQSVLTTSICTQKHTLDKPDNVSKRRFDTMQIGNNHKQQNLLKTSFYKWCFSVINSCFWERQSHCQNIFHR